jgi:hypothetical protein
VPDEKDTKEQGGADEAADDDAEGDVQPSTTR